MPQPLMLPREGIPITGSELPTREWYRFFFDLSQRVGGVLGSSTDDLATASFEDAGVEESRALLFATGDAANQAPPAEQLQAIVSENERLSEEIAELRAVVFELYKSLQGISQGVIQ